MAMDARTYYKTLNQAKPHEDGLPPHLTKKQEEHYVRELRNTQTSCNRKNAEMRKRHMKALKIKIAELKVVEKQIEDFPPISQDSKTV